jgi:peptidoglycan/xylan/chitin deacetylase (PgdA/CDA1 family)
VSPQLYVSLVVVAYIAVGVVAIFQHHEMLDDQAGALATQQASSRFVSQELAAAAMRVHQELPPTYSWISPVNCFQQPCIALTFDDGPNAATTPLVLSTLEKDQVHATFFVIGTRVVGNASLLQRMYADGDEIGNHSWTHPDMTTLKPDQVRQQVTLTQNIIASAGVPAPTLFRPPYGAVNPTVLGNVPLTVMFWNEDPKDWAASSPQQVEQAVVASAKPGGVVDMHDIYQVTANSLDPIIQKLKSEHYQFVTVSQLLGLKPGQQGSYYGYKPQDFHLSPD